MEGVEVVQAGWLGGEKGGRREAGEGGGRGGGKGEKKEVFSNIANEKEDIWVLMFFFEQKTAYEVKECDWSSDVCSSGLVIPNVPI